MHPVKRLASVLAKFWQVFGSKLLAGFFLASFFLASFFWLSLWQALQAQQVGCSSSNMRPPTKTPTRNLSRA